MECISFLSTNTLSASFFFWSRSHIQAHTILLSFKAPSPLLLHIHIFHFESYYYCIMHCIYLLFHYIVCLCLPQTLLWFWKIKVFFSNAYIYLHTVNSVLFFFAKLYQNERNWSTLCVKFHKHFNTTNTKLCRIISRKVIVYLVTIEKHINHFGFV